MHTHGHHAHSRAFIHVVLTWPRTHTFTHYAHSRTHSHTLVHMDTHKDTHSYTLTHTYTHAHGHQAHIHVDAYAHSRTFIHTGTQLDTHTHHHTLRTPQSGVTAGSSGPAQALGLGPCPPRATQSLCQQPGPPHLAPPAHPGHPVGLLSPALTLHASTPPVPEDLLPALTLSVPSATRSSGTLHVSVPPFPSLQGPPGWQGAW